MVATLFTERFLKYQFAYNEMSFMVIRLLQAFTSVEHDLSSTPPEGHPPAEWAKATGRKATEKVFPKMHLTMYTNVSVKLFCFSH